MPPVATLVARGLDGGFRRTAQLRQIGRLGIDGHDTGARGQAHGQRVALVVVAEAGEHRPHRLARRDGRQ
ncbi:hypothetical protein [uncultured Microbacterium sp.]|uniref:hypothetical protein n=1 Tax=uncultured Microbacterium sp. TaxID=191216 RepID=UPI0025D4D11A|nr:hypothetical protein [uncultured Microbacterium sp.]